MSQEYLTSNSHIAYPFRDSAAGLAYSVTDAGLPVSLVVDAAFDLDVPRQLYLKSCTRVDDKTLTVVISDQITTVLTLTVIATDKTYAMVSGTSSDKSVSGRILFSTVDLVKYLTVLQYGPAIDYGLTLPFEARVCMPASAHVVDIAIYNNGPSNPPTHTGITGDVILACGYNIDVSVPVVGTADATIGAVPGAGIGTEPCPTPGACASTVKSLSPVNGNIAIVGGADTCYAIVPSSTGLFQIQGHCEACCTCDDYAAALERVRTLCNRANGVLNYLQDARNEYEIGVGLTDAAIVRTYTVLYSLSGVHGNSFTDSDENEIGSPNLFRLIVDVINRTPNVVRPSNIQLGWGDAITSGGKPTNERYNSDGSRPTPSTGQTVYVDNARWLYNGRSAGNILTSGYIAGTPSVADDNTMVWSDMTGIPAIDSGNTLRLVFDVHTSPANWKYQRMSGVGWSVQALITMVYTATSVTYPDIYSTPGGGIITVL